MERHKIIDNLKISPEIDVLIIGGGINGAGTFLDLAVNDVRVLLIDRGDFCSGASAASSHMAHGGIRYLENGEFRLVKEAVAERNRMIQNSPHMVKPLPTVIPMFKFWSGLLNAPLKFLNWLDKPSERGAAVIKIGLILYDSYTGKQRTVPTHKFYGKKKTLSRYPRLNKDVKYTAEYYDGLMLSPERLNGEIIFEAEKASEKAMALNYASMEGVKDNFVVINDLDGQQSIKVKPKIIVNAAGPWIDDVNNRMGVDTKYVGGTKGSHIIVNNPVLKEAIGNHEFFFENKDGRIVLLLPFFDKVIIGTSDLPIEDPDDAVCTPEEEAYFINLVKRVFPDIPILPEQIVFRFSGVRPLEYQHAKTTGQITRDHSIKEGKVSGNPVLSLVGGKWTSYRAFGEQVCSRILELLNKQRRETTEGMKIGGGIGYPDSPEKIEKYLLEVSENTSTNIDQVKVLFERYGTLVENILSETISKSIKPINSNYRITENELVYLAKNEKVIHMDDLLLRRTSIGWLGYVNEDSLVEMSQVTGTVLGWDKARIHQEIERVRSVYKRYHSLNI
ncbi:MAG: glycerol-3-phosphate dehydrogenase/oxidase [Chloroflexi bacterium]|nr:glycerol-3-phosphate dehydrogenase/oxidase [Chloroflexota bacterium]